MTVSRAIDVPPPRVRSTEARAWGIALLTAAMWFDVLYAASRHVGTVPLPPSLAALAGLATQVAFTACEAAVAVQAWRVAGASVRWRELAPRLLAVSSIEALATAIAVGHTTVPQALAAWLAGPRAAATANPVSGSAFAFAAFGVLTVTRLLLSAHAQAGVARASYVRALLVVGTLYLATRLVMWWSFDLMQGRSFQRWG
jgi:hypothetical protein